LILTINTDSTSIDKFISAPSGRYTAHGKILI
jgi:hypothetical protein